MVVLLILLLVVGTTALIVWLPWWSLFYAGCWLAGIGMAVGVPAGVLYHVMLFRALRPTHVLGAAFWWRPLRFHSLLSATQRRRVMPWLYLGASAFFAIFVGCLLLGVGALRP